jgi:dipeptidyl aminopeptidase/acylaminoacyl peptidase
MSIDTSEDRFDRDLRRFLERQAAELDGSPSAAEMAARVAATVGRRSFVPPSQRLVWIVAVLGLLLAAVIAFMVGSQENRKIAVVLPSLSTSTSPASPAPSAVIGLPHRNGPIVVLGGTGRVAVDPVSGAISDYGSVTCTPGGSLCADPNQTRPLLDFQGSGTSVSWSPDGTKLASQYAGAVWVLDTLTNDAVRVTSAAATQGWPHQVVTWSPDGSHLAFADGGEIYTVNVDGSQRTEITHFGGSLAASQPAWSPDGSRIAFTLIGTGADASIASIDVDGTGLRTIVGSGVRVSSPVWSPDGSRLAYLYPDFAPDATGVAGSAELVTVRPDGSERTVVFTVANCCINFIGGDAAWSPDGTRIATILPGLDGYSLYVMDPRGTHVVQLVKGVDPEYPAWRPIP